MNTPLVTVVTTRHATKLRSWNSSRGMKGCAVNRLWTRYIHMPASTSIARTTISGESNQSRCSPRSRMNCRLPSDSASSAKPKASSGRARSGRPAPMNAAMSASVTMPMGKLMKKIQRHDSASVSQPPTAGPTIGPTITPVLQYAIASPCRDGG